MSILSVKNLTISYQSVNAVNNVSFDVEEGDYFCIVGSNGSGKSSLIKSIVGLVPIKGGTITSKLKKEEIAYLPQLNTISRDLPATVFEIVMTGTQKKARRLPFYSKEDVKIANEVMEMLEIKEFANRQIGALSGGQQQRVLLARALSRKPQLLILDEPCSGLDENITSSFYRTLTDLNKNKGVTIFMVSHDLHEVRNNAKHVAEMNRNLNFVGTARDWQNYSKVGGLK